MTAQTPAILKTYFQTNDKPTQAQYANLIDSYVNTVQTSGQGIISDISAMGSFDLPNNGMTVGNPTGGNKGTGTINAQSGFYVNGTLISSTSGGGSGTVNSGTSGQIGYYASSTNSISGNANASISSGALTLGQATSVLGSLVLSGSTSGTTILNPNIAASGTLTLPAATDTLIGKATTDTLTNKTFDTAATGNLFKINGTSITAISGNANKVATTSGSLTSGHLASFDGSGNVVDSGSSAPLITALAVGSIVFAKLALSSTVSAGSTTAASNLTVQVLTTNGGIGFVSTGDSITGTWKALQTVDSSAFVQAGWWQRIS